MTNQQPQTGKTTVFTTQQVQRMPKRWVMAKRKNKQSSRQRMNDTIEVQFMQILKATKQLLQGQAPKVFERNFRHDNTDSALAMHAFMTDSVHLYLECNFNFEYRLEYAFYNCTHELEIRKMLDAYILQGRITEITLQPSFTQFFHNTLIYQGNRYIYSL